jgi:putative transposase
LSNISNHGSVLRVCSAMQRVVCVKLMPHPGQIEAFIAAQRLFADACNILGLLAQSAKVKDRFDLHRLGYYDLRDAIDVPSQVAVLAIKQVASAYKTLSKLGRLHGDKPWPTLNYCPDGACAFDARTYRVLKGGFSLLTPHGRIVVPCVLGKQQRRMARLGTPQEARLVCKRGKWYLHVVVRSADPAQATGKDVLGVDVGELTMAATSSGMVRPANRMKHARDMSRAHSKRLKRKGTQSAKQAICKVKGREARQARHHNHVCSRELVKEAQRLEVGTIAMEDLTHIRDRIKAGRRMRGRLHRWPWRQLQDFVAYKAEEVGIRAVFVDPAYTSKTCSRCHCLGTRKRHLFVCSCGSQRHADVNAASNIRWLAQPIGRATPFVTAGNVAHEGLHPLLDGHKSPVL